VTVILGARETRKEKERKDERKMNEGSGLDGEQGGRGPRMREDRISEDRFRSAKTGCIAHQSRNSFDRAEMARRALMA